MKKRVEDCLKKVLPPGIDPDVSVPEHDSFGHYSTSAPLKLAQKEKKNPREVAEQAKKEILNSAPAGFLDKVEVAGPGFLNLWLSNSAIQNEFKKARRTKNFGNSDAGKGARVIVEYSQPNIAKRLHTGHLRNTILGDALSNIEEASGYKVMRWNYLGDWGTQFGKLIAAWKRWGSEKEMADKPIDYLEGLYVRFSQAAKEDAALEAAGREEFKKLEEGDAENRKLWKRFKQATLLEVGRIYDALGIKFDTYIGEAFFEDKMKPLTDELEAKGISEVSEGATIVRLEAEGLPPALIKKSDGTSLYLTRDIAALEYRTRKYSPKRFLYVVGNEQSLHFSQLFAVAKRLGLGENCELEHVKYGLLLSEAGKKMSTREGTSVPLAELLERAVVLAEKTAAEKNSRLRGKKLKETARQIGIGAMKFAILKENKMTDIAFDWEKMLEFRGMSAPYLQYTHARLRSLVKKAGWHWGGNENELAKPEELSLMRKIFEFPEAVISSGENLAPNILAEYAFDLANAANRFYEAEPILGDKSRSRRSARLQLAAFAASVLKRSLSLLGIGAPEEI